ncbi:hypothetical protein GCM10027297_14610 [Parahaliea aestuarii]
MVAFLKAQPGERGAIDGVGAFLADGGKIHGDPARLDFDNNTQSKLGIGMADPALSDLVFHRLPVMHGQGRGREEKGA